MSERVRIPLHENQLLVNDMSGTSKVVMQGAYLGLLYLCGDSNGRLSGDKSECPALDAIKRFVDDLQSGTNSELAAGDGRAELMEWFPGLTVQELNYLAQQVMNFTFSEAYILDLQKDKPVAAIYQEETLKDLLELRYGRLSGPGEEEFRKRASRIAQCFADQAAALAAAVGAHPRVFFNVLKGAKEVWTDGVESPVSRDIRQCRILAARELEMSFNAKSPSITPAIARDLRIGYLRQRLRLELGDHPKKINNMIREIYHFEGHGIDSATLKAATRTWKEGECIKQMRSSHDPHLNGLKELCQLPSKAPSYGVRRMSIYLESR